MNWLRDKIEALLNNEINRTKGYNECDNSDSAFRSVLSLIDQAKCEYKLIDDDCNLYECSNCGIEWEFMSGNPKDNDAEYCSHCGFKIKNL